MMGMAGMGMRKRRRQAPSRSTSMIQGYEKGGEEEYEDEDEEWEL
jgi:hypothetical protein